MKKIAIFSTGVILLILFLLPFIIGDLEKEDLNSDTRSQLEGNFIELSDGFTHYELKGPKDGKTIILVHGNAAPYVTWDYTFDALVNSGFRVLRYDIYGHGYSDRPNLEAYNNELYDRQLTELIEKLGIKYPVYLVGTSQGGSICAYFAANHPYQVEKIAFLSPMFDDFEGKNMWSLLKTKGLGEYLISVLGDKFFTNPSKVLYLNEKKDELTEKLLSQMHYKGKKKAVLANIRGDALNDPTIYYKQVKQQDIPVLLTWADHDKSISQESMKRLCELIPNIQYHQIKNASHLAHYEIPEEINPILIDFFRTEK